VEDNFYNMLERLGIQAGKKNKILPAHVQRICKAHDTGIQQIHGSSGFTRRRQWRTLENKCMCKIIHNPIRGGREARLARGRIREHEAILCHEMGGPVGTGRGDVSMAGGRQGQGTGISRTIGSYSRILWVWRRPSLSRFLLAAQEEFFTPKEKPAGEKGGGEQDLTNLPPMVLIPGLDQSM
jgi:hypothetical protein